MKVIQSTEHAAILMLRIRERYTVLNLQLLLEKCRVDDQKSERPCETSLAPPNFYINLSKQDHNVIFDLSVILSVDCCTNSQSVISDALAIIAQSRKSFFASI